MLDKDQIITVANTPDYVYTQNTSEKDVYTDLGAALCNDAKGQTSDEEYTWTAFINGEEVKAEIPEKNEGDDYTYTAKGTVTEIYVDDYDQTVTVVEINYYLGKVSKVNEANGTINVRELSAEPNLDDDSFAATGFEKDDYVVFTVDFNDDDDFYICELMAPETVTGEVYRVQNDKDSDNSFVMLDGEDTKYYYTSGEHMTYDVTVDGDDDHPTLNEEYMFYMTPAGYVLGFEPTEEVIDQYLYVQDSDEELRDWKASVNLPDGSNPVVDLKDSLKNTPDSDVTYVNEAGNGALTAVTGGKHWADEIQWVINKDTDDENRTSIDNRIWKYTVNDSDVYSLTWVANYVLGTKDTVTYDDDDFTAEIKNGKAYITEVHKDAAGNDVEDDENNVLIDKNTIFVDTMNDVAYTGYDEVPNVSNALLVYVLDKNVAEIVFILDGDIYDTNATYFMLDSLDRLSGEDGEAGDFWIYDGTYVNGDNAKLQITYDAVSKLTGSWKNQLDLGTLYKATKTIEDGEFIDEIEKIGTYTPAPTNTYVAAKNDGAYNGTVQDVGVDAFWITIKDNKTVKFDTDEETTYVTVRYVKTLDGKGGYDDEWIIDDGDINDLKAITPDRNFDYFAKQVHVVTRENDNTARLVYIFWTEAEKGTSVAVNFEGIANADVKVNGFTVADDANVSKNSDVTIEIAADAGYTLTGVTLNGAAQTIKDGKCTITIKNITSAQDIVVTTEKNTAVKVDLFFEDDGLVTIGEDNYASNTQLTLVEGKTYTAEIAIPSDTTPTTSLEVRYNGTPLAPIGGKYVFVAEDGATLVVNDVRNDGTATGDTAAVATQAELAAAFGDSNVKTIYMGSGEFHFDARVTRDLTIIGNGNSVINKTLQVYAGATEVKIQNVTFKTTDRDGIQLIDAFNGNITVENCKFEGMQVGLQLGHMDTAVIRNNTFVNCSFAGIIIGDVDTKVTIEDNPGLSVVAVKAASESKVHSDVPLFVA